MRLFEMIFGKAKPGPVTPEDPVSRLYVRMENEYQADVFFCAATLVAEARGEGYEGMHAVMSVIVNRLAAPASWWHREGGDSIPDDTLAAVCLDPSQFSCWNDGKFRGRARDPNYDLCLNMADPGMLAENLKNRSFAMALSLAVHAVHGDLQDIVEGATHYHTRGIKPVWSAGKEPVLSLGNHFFYNNIG